MSFDLAKKLNMVETLSAHASFTRPQFNFLIIIDFEATCWEKPCSSHEQEIIEFPAILVNLESGRIQSEFRLFVQPVNVPQLSIFCKNLTGITQDQVDHGVQLAGAIVEFNNWLKELTAKYNLRLPRTVSDDTANTAFATWSDWDLGVCLKRECERKRIRRPGYFDLWIDLKLIFIEWYKYKPLTFNDALSHLNMKFVGREHSGIDDSKNIAYLACRMVNDGASMRITKDSKSYLASNKVAGALK